MGNPGGTTGKEHGLLITFRVPISAASAMGIGWSNQGVVTIRGDYWLPSIGVGIHF